MGHQKLKMDKDICIRKAQNDDIGALKTILFSALQEYNIPIPDNFSVADIDSIGVQTSAEQVFVLQKDDTVFGFVVLRPVTIDCIDLKRLYLTSTQRGKGLGKHLLNYALDFAVRNNYKSIRLETTSRFKEAVALYEKSGFKVIKEAQKSPGHDLVLEKNLKPTILHITSGDAAGRILAESGIPGEVLVWHDILYDGPRSPGWPDDDTLAARAGFLEKAAGGGLSRASILDTLNAQYNKLRRATEYDRVVLWFDACLFDQAMLCHILACLRYLRMESAELLCIDAYPGIEPFHGIGQLSPKQLATMDHRRQSLTAAQWMFAERVDRAFALQDPAAFQELASWEEAPLPWVPAAVGRWLAEQPDGATGLGRLESLALEAIRAGCRTPAEIFAFVSKRDTPPQYWGDITLWARINGLAEREPPLVRIQGPTRRLPQWEGIADLKQFLIFPEPPMGGEQFA